MKKLITLVLLGTIAVRGFAQSVSVPSIDSKEYEALKKNGKMPANIQYTHPKTFTPSLEDLKNAGAIIHAMPPEGGCGCYKAPDGTYTLAMAPNDDGSTSEIPIPFTFCLYGANYNSIYINNNGNISFGTSYSSFSSNPFPDPSFIMVAPFWADVDTRGTGTVKYKITSTAVYVNWDAVGYYSEYTDKVNTFQLIITDGTDPVLPEGDNVAFCYKDMQWTTGDASGGMTTGFGGTLEGAYPATVGLNRGDGIGYVQIGRFAYPGAAFDGGYGADDGVDWLDNQSIYFNSCSGTNFAPIPSINPPLIGGGAGCDTLRVCGTGDTLLISTLFLAPELGQTTSIAIDLHGTPGATIISNDTGNTASAVVQIIASPGAAGDHVFTFVATDNGTPPQSTTVNINVFIDTTGLAGFNPHITGVTKVCEGAALTLHVEPTTYDAYSWSTGSLTDSAVIHAGGLYWVTAREGLCSKTTSVNVGTNPLPVPNILGPLFSCNTTFTTLSVESPSLYPQVAWSNAVIGDSITVLSGIYAVTVTDTNGCKGSDTVHVLDINPVVSILGVSDFCPGVGVTLIANPSIAPGAQYAWSNSVATQNDTVQTTGTYVITVSYSNGCTAVDSATVTEYDGPVAAFSTSPPATTAAMNSITFTDLSTIASGSIAAWNWNFGDGSATSTSTLQNPTHSYAIDGTYHVSLAVQSNNGCWDTVYFDYVIASDVMVPNVFTPNNDGKNDFLAFKNLEFFPGTSIAVYNRWGEKVYSNSDYHNDWDGGGHSDGIYYFVLTGPKLKETKLGFVELIK